MRPAAPGSDPLAGLELRTAARPEDFRRFLGLLETSFAEDISEEDWQEWQATLPIDRIIAMFDGDRAVGSAGDVPFELTVPGGGRVGAAGVTAVGVLPTHRRRGILRRLMLHQLAATRDRGEPVAILWASEGAIYQRFGYGLATVASEFELDRTRTAFADPPMPLGTIRLLDEAEALAACPGIYEPVARRTPGMLSRSEAWWHAVLSDSAARRSETGRKRVALLEVDGTGVGYAIHRVKSDWEARGPKGLVTVLEVVSTTPAAEIELWRWLVGIDLVGTIRGVRGRLPHPLQLRLAEPRRLGLMVSDAIWLRLVDLPAALAARGYAAPGSIVLEVVDESCPWNAGRWRLTVDGRPGAAPGPNRAGTVERTGDEPDLRLDVADLGAAYLGGTRILDLVAAARIEARTDGSAALASAMFASDVAPWCCTTF